MEIIKVKEVNKELLNEFCRRILKIVQPVKIILFGSYVYGKPDENSDLDILVIVDNVATTRREVRIKIRKALREFLIPKDIIVATTNDIEEWKGVPQAFITKITKRGRIIYERQD